MTLSTFFASKRSATLSHFWATRDSRLLCFAYNFSPSSRGDEGFRVVVMTFAYNMLAGKSRPARAFCGSLTRF